MAKHVGGRHDALYYHFGVYDGTLIGEFPDDVSANAVLVAVLGSGPVRSTKSARPFTPKDAVGSFGKAGKILCQPPGRK